MGKKERKKRTKNAEPPFVAEFYTCNNMSDLVLRLAGDATVRGATTYDAKQVFSVYDSMALFCGKSESYARTTWFRLISEKSEHKEELEDLVYSVTLRNAANNKPYDTPAMTLQGLQRLFVILGGKVAAEFRVIVLGVFTRYMGGDRSMIEEIRANAASDAPVHQAYRQALAQEPVLDAVGTKRQLEREEALFEFELKERTARLKDSEISRMQNFCGLMTSLNPDWKKDTRLRMQIEDSMKTALFGGQALITNGASPATSPSISVSQVAQELGLRLKSADSIAIGRAVATKYRERYGEPPSKHRQWVDGAERDVCSYTERDRDLLESSIRERA
jgi:hypothetical protein